MSALTAAAVSGLAEGRESVVKDVTQVGGFRDCLHVASAGGNGFTVLDFLQVADTLGIYKLADEREFRNVMGF